MFFFFFFFQAEDGIRDLYVTGVQTCALPIYDFSKYKENCEMDRRAIEALGSALAGSDRSLIFTSVTALVGQRSEERRVGKSVDLGGRRIIKKKKRKKKEEGEDCSNK